MAEYNIAGDLDVNKFEGGDIRDLTQAGVGSGLRQVSMDMELILATILIGFFAFLFAGLFVLFMSYKKN